MHRLAALATLVGLASVAEGARPPAAPIPAADGLLTEAMVRRLRGFSGPMLHRTMFAPEATYADVHWQATGKPERFDVALRVWTDPAMYDQLRAQLPKTRDLAQLGKMFSAREDDIIGIGFAARGVVVLITCGIEQCPTVGAAAALAREVRARLPR